jgi:hypothetical protein
MLGKRKRQRMASSQGRVNVSKHPLTPQQPLRRLTTSTKSNIGVVECSSSAERPLGEGVVVLIPNFQVAPLLNQLLVDRGESGTGLMFTRKPVAVITSENRWNGEEKERDDGRRLHCLS